GAVTVASDVYGLGAVLYALLTGRAPFRGESTLETLQQVRERPPERPSRFKPRTPAELEIVCLKCLEEDPARRAAHAAAVREDLRRFVEGRPIRARRASGIERTWRWCRRNPTAAGFLVASSIAALAMVGVVVGFHYNTQLNHYNTQLNHYNTQLKRQREVIER